MGENLQLNFTAAGERRRRERLPAAPKRTAPGRVLQYTARATAMGLRAALLAAASPALAAAASFADTYGPSTGCGQAPPYDPSSPRQSAYFEDSFDGNERGYLMHLPTSYDQNRPTPIVISFHGWSMSAQNNWEWM